MSKFNSRERDLLVEICQNYPILTDMGYSLGTINRKKEAWMKIQAEFNSMNPGKPPKDVPQLKGLWKRIKTKTKASMDASKKDARQTEGGPSKPPLGRAEQILSEMFEGQFDPLSDTMDDGAGPFQEQPEIETEKQKDIHFYETPNRTKSNQILPEQLLEMARTEHLKKMNILDLKEKNELIKAEANKLKLILLKQECKIKNILP